MEHFYFPNCPRYSFFIYKISILSSEAPYFFRFWHCWWQWQGTEGVTVQILSVAGRQYRDLVSWSGWNSGLQPSFRPPAPASAHLMGWACQTRYLWAVLRIHVADPWNYCTDPDPGIPTSDRWIRIIFVSDLQDVNKKFSFCFLRFEGTFTSDPDSYLMRMRIQVPKMMRIRIHKHCLWVKNGNPTRICCCFCWINF